MSDNVLELTDADFQKEVLESDVPVLVDFWAEWCMPCKMVAPVVEELAGEYAGRAKFAKMDTDSNRQAAMKLDIRAIPTLFVFQDGQVARKFVGVQPKSELKAALDELLG